MTTSKEIWARPLLYAYCTFPDDDDATQARLRTKRTRDQRSSSENEQMALSLIYIENFSKIISKKLYFDYIIFVFQSFWCIHNPCKYIITYKFEKNKKNVDNHTLHARYILYINMSNNYTYLPSKLVVLAIFLTISKGITVVSLVVGLVECSRMFVLFSLSLLQPQRSVLSSLPQTT